MRRCEPAALWRREDDADARAAAAVLRRRRLRHRRDLDAADRRDAESSPSPLGITSPSSSSASPCSGSPPARCGSISAGEASRPDELSYDLSVASLAFALATVVALLFQLTIVTSVPASVMAFVVWVQFAVALSLPFFFAGVAVSLALTRSPYPVGVVYGVDLCGAALGCLAALVLLNLVSGPSAALWIAALAAAGGLLFSDAKPGGATRPSTIASRLHRRRWAVFGALCVLAAANSLTTAGVRPTVVKDKLERPEHIAYERWNSFSRITVDHSGKASPAVWGRSSQLPPQEIEQRWMTIDGLAGTAVYRFTGKLEELSFLRYDVTNLAYAVPGLKTAAVIGVGGGRDLLSARLFGVPEVVGVEINPIFIDLLTRQLRGLHRHRPRAGNKLRGRRGAQLVRPHRPVVRPPPDEPDRHLGGDRRRRLHALGKRPLHRRGVADLPRAADAGRRVHGQPLVRARRGQRDRADDQPRRRDAAGSRRRRAEAPPVRRRIRDRRDAGDVPKATLRSGPCGARRGRRDLRFPRSPQPRDRSGLAAPAGHRCGDRSPGARAGGPELPSRSQPTDRCAPVLLQPAAACPPSRRGHLHARLTPRRVRRQPARHPDACDPDPRLGDPRGGHDRRSAAIDRGGGRRAARDSAGRPISGSSAWAS